VIKDDLAAEIGGTTLYNMGPYCGGYRREGRNQAGLLGDYVKNTFGERPFTRLRYSLFYFPSHFISNSLNLFNN